MKKLLFVLLLIVSVNVFSQTKEKAGVICDVYRVFATGMRNEQTNWDWENNRDLTNTWQLFFMKKKDIPSISKALFSVGIYRDAERVITISLLDVGKKNANGGIDYVAQVDGNTIKSSVELLNRGWYNELYLRYSDKEFVFKFSEKDFTTEL